jgi:hypothetical protein
MSEDILFVGNQSMVRNVTLLSPITVIANQSTVGQSGDTTLILKVDNEDEDAKDVCMMITVQVSIL